jgi:uncharacterized protein
VSSTKLSKNQGDMRYWVGAILILNFNCLGQQEKLTGRDVRIYKDTPVWEAALAIRDNDTTKLRKLLANQPNTTLNHQEKYYGQSLLNWAVYRDNYESAMILAELGADPNLKGNDSTSAFINAADKFKTSDYVRLLLKNGGDVNAIADIEGPQHLRTPLIAAAFKRLESVKILIQAGANPNYIHRIKRGNIGGEIIQSALIYAFNGKKIDVVKYLLIEVGVDFDYVFSTTIDGTPHYVLYYLRDMVFPLDSEEHKIKMEVVAYLKTKGLDYWSEPIPELYKRQYDKSYLDKY